MARNPALQSLTLAGLLSSAVALLHFVILFIGPPGYRYFGAGERMARLDERGSWIPGLITLGLTLIFSVWAAYAFSGAGRLNRLPLRRTALVLIGSVYALRGLVLFPQVALFLSVGGHEIPPRHLVFSAVSLLTGLAYLIGTRQAWRQL